MNAPLPEPIRKALETVTLDDKYALERGRAFMSGVQALVRLPMLQRAARCASRQEHRRLHQRLPRLAARRLRPGAVEGRKHLAANNIVFQPGVNEELAATALWGTQQLGLRPGEQQVRRRVRHLVRQGPGRGPLLATSSSTPTWPAPRRTAA